MRIKIVQLDVNDRGLLVLKLSANPPEQWRGFFEERLLSPSNFSGTFRKGVFAGWEAPGLGPLFKTTPEDFESNYKSIAIAAVEHANNELRKAEDKQADKARADVAKDASATEELERQRQKARAIKFP